MITIVCLPCSFAMHVMPVSVASTSSIQELDQLVGKRSQFWPDKYPCTKCGKFALGFSDREIDQNIFLKVELREVTPHEAFAALNGLGFPEEQKCSLDYVNALLKEKPVRRVIGTNVSGMERTILDALELWDGTKVYFGAGAEGAVIYRITRPVSYTRQELKESDA